MDYLKLIQSLFVEGIYLAPVAGESEGLWEEVAASDLHSIIKQVEHAQVVYLIACYSRLQTRTTSVLHSYPHDISASPVIVLAVLGGRTSCPGGKWATAGGLAPICRGAFIRGLTEAVAGGMTGKPLTTPCLCRKA